MQDSRHWAYLLAAVLTLACLVQTLRLHQARQWLDVPGVRTALGEAGYDLGESDSTELGPDADVSMGQPSDSSEEGLEEESMVHGAGDDELEVEANEQMTHLIDEAVQALMDRPVRKRAAVKDKREAESKEEKEKEEEDDGSNEKRSRNLLNQARGALEMGDFDQARRLLEGSIEADPENRKAYGALAKMNRALGLNEAEAQVYADWMEALPGDSLPHYLLAGAYERMGLDAEAFEQLQAFQSMSGGDPSTYPMVAGMLRQLGLREDEGAALATWAGAVPDSPDARRALGDYYRRIGDYGGAVAEYEAVVALTPENANAHASLATAYTRAGLYADAQAQYEAALSLRPGSLGIMQQLAASYRRSGDLLSAADTYRQIINTEPGSPQANRAARDLARIERSLKPKSGAQGTIA